MSQELGLGRSQEAPSRGAESVREPAGVALTYAIGDVHGRHDLLAAALDAIETHAGDRPANVICLGDYVDRGPQSRQVIETLMAGPRRPGDDWTCLRGNHEDLMIGAHRGDIALVDCWMGNGGVQALASYGAEGVPAEHIAWLDSLPYMAADDHRVYVHAGLMPGHAPEAQQPEWVTWIRDRFLLAGADPVWGGKHVVHGHTPDEEPELLGWRTNLDTGACWTGTLTVGVFERDRPGGPVELLVVQGQAQGGAGNTTPAVARHPVAADGEGEAKPNPT